MWNNPETYFQLALGIALFAFGVKLFRFGISAAGFALGFLFGFSLYSLLQSLIPLFNPDFHRYFPDNLFVIAFFSGVFGFLGVMLAKRSYLAMVFIAVLAAGLYILYTDEGQRELVRSFFDQVGILQSLDNTLGEGWYALLALLVAVLFLYLENQVVIVGTACVGAYIIASTINIPILFLPLCFIGYLVQQKQKPLRKAEG